MLLFFFFFKQKTAYEMRISDWSSDVCSSDLAWWPACIVQSSWDGPAADDRTALATLSISTVLGTETYFLSVSNDSWKSISEAENLSVAFGFEIGRASCRERVCQYV